jgi:cysteine sulfinate desulfinase/cysteine desulfurase-like protein
MNVDDQIVNNAIRVSLGWATKKNHITSFLNFFGNSFNKSVLEQ